MKTYTTGEIAALCDVNLRTVIRWIERGVLNGFKLPGRGNNRVKEEDFIAFLYEHGMPIPPSLEQQASNHILIVDDEEAVAKAIQRTLKLIGYQTSTVSDGFQAGALLAKEKPALITLDLMMPGLSGYDVLEFIRGSEDYASIKVLVISALEEDCLEKALRLGADAVIQKPFDNKELQQKVEALLKLRAPYRTVDR